LSEDSVRGVVNLDKQTYAGRGRNLEHKGLDSDHRYKYIRGDICDKSLVREVLRGLKKGY